MFAENTFIRLRGELIIIKPHCTDEDMKNMVKLLTGSIHKGFYTYVKSNIKTASPESVPI